MIKRCSRRVPLPDFKPEWEIELNLLFLIAAKFNHTDLGLGLLYFLQPR